MKGSNRESPVRGKWIGVVEAQAVTGMSKDWFYRHMDAGTLPFPWYMKSLGKRAMDSADIVDWLWSIRVPAGSMPEDKKEAS